MARLRNVSGTDLAVYRPTGQPGSIRVPAGEVLEVGDAHEHNDAYLVGDGDDARLFPKALWALEQPTTTTTTGTSGTSRRRTETEPTSAGEE